jgi:hypothetical protein
MDAHHLRSSRRGTTTVTETEGAADERVEERVDELELAHSAEDVDGVRGDPAGPLGDRLPAARRRLLPLRTVAADHLLGRILRIAFRRHRGDYTSRVPGPGRSGCSARMRDPRPGARTTRRAEHGPPARDGAPADQTADRRQLDLFVDGRDAILIHEIVTGLIRHDVDRTEAGLRHLGQEHPRHPAPATHLALRVHRLAQ